FGARALAVADAAAGRGDAGLAVPAVADRADVRIDRELAAQQPRLAVLALGKVWLDERDRQPLADHAEAAARPVRADAERAAGGRRQTGLLKRRAAALGRGRPGEAG